MKHIILLLLLAMLASCEYPSVKRKLRGTQSWNQDLWSIQHLDTMFIVGDTVTINGRKWKIIK